MLFSVIIPVYNVEKYIDECIQSVLNQSFNDWEIILVDDGSTDSSGQICDKYALEYPEKIKVFHKKNEGQILTRTYGIKNAQGEYFVFLDSDDMLKNDCLEKLGSVIENTNSDMIIYKYSKSPEFTDEYTLPLALGCLKKQDVYNLACTSAFLNNIWLKCVKRDCCDIEADYSKYSFVKNSEDLLQSLPIIDKCRKPYYLDEPLYYYRTNNDSITHTYQDNYAESTKTVRRISNDYAQKWGVCKECVLNYQCEKVLDVYAYLFFSKQNFFEKIKMMYKLSYDDFYRINYNSNFIKDLSVKRRMLYLFVAALCKIQRIVRK